jgi:shikimate kinase
MLYGSRKIIALSLSLLLNSHAAHAIDPLTIAIAAKVVLATVLTVRVVKKTVNDIQDKMADNAPKAPEGTVIPGMAGVYDKNIGDMLREWQNDTGKDRSKSRLYKNCMILHGPKGNGKTTLARNVAEQMGVKFMFYDGTTLIDGYMGGGARKIEEIFEDAIALAEKEGKRVMICIDEFDLIAAIGHGGKGDTSRECEKTQAKLWLCLDKYKNDNRIFFVGTTNKLEVFDERAKDRFSGSLIEVRKPDAVQREAVFKQYFRERNDIDLEQICAGKCKNDFIKNTEGFSNRDLENLNIEIKKKVVFGNAGKITPALIEAERKSFADKIEQQKKEEAEKKELQKPQGLSVWDHAKGAVVNTIITFVFNKLCGNNAGNNAGNNPGGNN